MVVVGLTDKLFPVPTGVPVVHEPVYQLITEFVPGVPPISIKLVLCPLHIVVAVALAVGVPDDG